MTDPISSISAISGLPQLPAIGQSSQPGAFQNVLNGAIQSIESTQSAAGDAMQKFLTGENEEVHSMAIAMQKADITFNLGLQVRNKIVDAYQQVMQMQL